MKLTKSESSILDRHGADLCLRAYAHTRSGNGTSTIRWEIVGEHVAHRTVESIINVGRKLAEAEAADQTYKGSITAAEFAATLFRLRAARDSTPAA